MSASATNPVRERRTQLSLTQQEAARRAEVSVATWRRLEAAGDLDGFKAENVRGFARALRLSLTEFQQLMGSESAVEADAEESKTVQFFNAAFTGDPISAADAMELHLTVVFSDFAPMTDKKFLAEHALGCGFPAYLKGEASIREVDLLRDLPELALTQVNNHWLVRMGERIMRVGDELGKGRIPHPQCLADEYALSIVIMNTEPPILGGPALDMYPGLNGAADNDDYDEGELIEEWRDSMFGALLPPDEANDFRRHDLLVMEAHGQGIYDVADPRHPLRWFDRDDLRERCAASLAYVRMSPEEQDAHSQQVIVRLDRSLTPESA